MTREIKAGIWIAIAGFVWAVFEHIAGLHSTHIEMHGFITWFAFLPVIAIYIVYYRYIRKSLGLYLTWATAFKKGLLVTAVASLLSPVAFLLFYYLISPNFFVTFSKYVIEKKIMTQGQAAAYFNLNSYLLQIFIGILLVGIILSVILSFIFKSKVK